MFQVKLATSNPFATHSTAVELAWKSYAESYSRLASNSNGDHLLAKMKKDSQFAKDTITVVCLTIILYLYIFK